MKLFAFSFFFFCFLIALGWTLVSDYQNPYAVVCDLVAEKIYLSEKKIQPWHQQCLDQSRHIRPWTSRANTLKELRNQLQLLRVSHLEIYQPAEVEQIWAGRHQETGIDSEFVDSELVLFKVYPGSPAEKAGLRYGDIIVSLNGEQPNPWELNDRGGEVVFRRQGVEKKILLNLGEVVRDSSLEIKEVLPRVWVVKVPSFRREFFEKDWVTPKIQKARRVILDLRGNRGGTFVAGFRLMAPFFCKSQEVGRLDREVQRSNSPLNEFPNTLDEKAQLRFLQRPVGLILRTPASQTCIEASQIKVLVDNKTASVAEMVAQSMREVKGAEVLGGGTSGEMLVGVWYPLPEFGRGVEISIPEAEYKSLKGRSLESQGVEVNQSLYYDLKPMEKGLDPWLEQAKTRP